MSGHLRQLGNTKASFSLSENQWFYTLSLNWISESWISAGDLIIN